jgi:hypothetical protein
MLAEAARRAARGEASSETSPFDFPACPSSANACVFGCVWALLAAGTGTAEVAPGSPAIAPKVSEPAPMSFHVWSLNLIGTNLVTPR